MDQHARRLVGGERFEPEAHRFLPRRAAGTGGSRDEPGGRRGVERAVVAVDHRAHGVDPRVPRERATPQRSTARPPSCGIAWARRRRSACRGRQRRRGRKPRSSPQPRPGRAGLPAGTGSHIRRCWPQESSAEISRASEKTRAAGRELVEPVVVHPVAGALDRDDAGRSGNAARARPRPGWTPSFPCRRRAASGSRCAPTAPRSRRCVMS